MTAAHLPQLRRQPRLYPEAGFSMLEAIISLAILALLLTLAFAGRSLINNRRLVGAARTVGTEIRWVEQRARSERRCWRLVFEPAVERYRIQYYAGGTWSALSSCTGGTWTEYTGAGGRELPQGIDLMSTSFRSNPPDTMQVSPYGNPNGGTVLLQSPNGEAREITVEVGGRVTIERP